MNRKVVLYAVVKLCVETDISDNDDLIDVVSDFADYSFSLDGTTKITDTDWFGLYDKSPI